MKYLLSVLLSFLLLVPASAGAECAHSWEYTPETPGCHLRSCANGCGEERVENCIPWGSCCICGQENAPSDRELIVAAHRGYHTEVKENTTAAFLAAVDAGFTWSEVDIAVTRDNVLILSHYDEIALYRDGQPMHLFFSQTDAADLDGLTWDAAGKNPVSTLRELFLAMKGLDMTIVCDLKFGTNDMVFQTALDTGMEDQIFLSFPSASAALEWADRLAAYPHTGVRVVPWDGAELEALQDTLRNPIIADINATFLPWHEKSQTALSNALSARIPVLMSGCTLENAPLWAPVASGVMANGSTNLSVTDFLTAAAVPAEGSAPLVRPASLNLNTKGFNLLSAQGDPNESLYALSLDPAIASLRQMCFGSSIDIWVDAIAPGSTVIRVFSSGGAYVDIPVTVI